jgi:nitrate reductase / nitrite oxidoreductase, alpha subunit
MNPPVPPGVDGKASDALLKLGRFFTRWEESDDGRVAFRKVRSTHGVNCTGACSWKIYVRHGIITWEAQQTDYPSVGPDRPEYEPRGCPRGAAFSWYTLTSFDGLRPQLIG